MLNLANLDQARPSMMVELESDIAAGTLYLSARFNDHGKQRYPALLREAIMLHDDAWLAAKLRAEGCFKQTETRKTKNGTVQAAVPVTAADTLAEGEFNRFYARGICAFALSAGHPSLLVYRAKEVAVARTESERLIGTTVDPQTLLTDLRTHLLDTALHLPNGPNSGLSVRLPS